ncbi:MAG: tRNA (adenosine(37)-N6)-threonylcarbamoyltransferase complex transferase subunit TsaD [Thioalkalivibrionaceae bacterium]
MRVLGIETSCDETGVALVEAPASPVAGGATRVVAEALFSQIDLHAAYGGVVPELASRDHVRRLLPMVRKVMAEADWSPQTLDAIAYTAGPGLIGALMVGAATAEALSLGWNVPTIPVHHLEGHLIAARLDAPELEFPFLVLLVSGGHTQFLDARALGDYRLLGESIDDAAGESFDKTAQLLDLGYPGGPAVSRLAEFGDDGAVNLPRPMCDRAGLDMSFSGLKTAVRLAIESGRHRIEDVAASFERAVVDVLSHKLEQALAQTGRRELVVAGGVAANRRLRARFETIAAARGVRLRFPRLEWCTDNGAMIAAAGIERLRAAACERSGDRARHVGVSPTGGDDAVGEPASSPRADELVADCNAIVVRPRWPLTEPWLRP